MPNLIAPLEGAERIWFEPAVTQKMFQVWDEGGQWNVDRVAVELLRRYPVSSKDVLDLGCGIGRYIDFLSPRNYFGVDHSEGMLAEGRRRHPTKAFIQSSVEEFVPEVWYDLTLLIAVINHSEYPNILLQQVLENVADWTELVIVSYYCHASQDNDEELYHDYGSEFGKLSRSIDADYMDEIITDSGWKVEERQEIPDLAHATRNLRIRIDVLRKRG